MLAARRSRRTPADLGRSGRRMGGYVGRAASVPAAGVRRLGEPPPARGRRVPPGGEPRPARAARRPSPAVHRRPTPPACGERQSARPPRPEPTRRPRDARYDPALVPRAHRQEVRRHFPAAGRPPRHGHFAATLGRPVPVEPAPSGAKGASEPALAPGGEVLDVAGAAQLLRIGRNTVYELVARNAIPYRRPGKQIRFSRAAIMRWLDRWSLQDAKEGQ
jgi:excisionase family DNA binding protein